jgi:hypothetical protein
LQTKTTADRERKQREIEKAKEPQQREQSEKVMRDTERDDKISKSKAIIEKTVPESKENREKKKEDVIQTARETVSHNDTEHKEEARDEHKMVKGKKWKRKKAQLKDEEKRKEMKPISENKTSNGKRKKNEDANINDAKKMRYLLNFKGKYLK